MGKREDDRFIESYQSLGGGTGCPKPRPDGTMSTDPADLARPMTTEEILWMLEHVDEITPLPFT